MDEILLKGREQCHEAVLQIIPITVAFLLQGTAWNGRHRLLGLAGRGAAEPGKVLHPVALSKDVLAGKGLIDFDPWPKAMQIKPIKSHRSISWFVGETLTSIIYEADDGLLTFTDLPYEEHVRILHGRAILTSVDGHRQIFDPGDDFIVPKGWSGTWQLSGQYREIATFDDF
jgi:uncharacterized cupin superfamily protein